MLTAIEKYALSTNSDVKLQDLADGQFVCAVSTLLMKRIHQQVKQSQEMVFIDSTSHIDQTNSALTILLCASSIGALPLGVIISSAQDQRAYTTGKFIFKYSNCTVHIYKDFHVCFKLVMLLLPTDTYIT